MIGQRERKIAVRQRTVTVVIVAVALLVAVIPSIRNVALQALSPAFKKVQEISAGWQKRAETKRTVEEANKEIERLHALSTGLIFDRTEYERLKRENVELREMVKYEAPEKFRTVPCGIIAFDVSSERKLTTLDCGSDRGVNRGNAVLSPEGILLGTVQESNANHAIVQLLKDPMSKVAAEVSGTSDSQGIVMPVGGGAVALRYLGENVKVEPASIVQTSGLLDQVPAGIPIGTIDATVKETDTPFQRAIIQTPIDPATLTLVNVLIVL